MNNQFNTWQNKEIYTHNYGYTSINTLISIFIKEGIMPFVASHKYKYGDSKYTIENAIATTIFHLYHNRFYICDLPKDINFTDEHYNNYIYYIDWDSFWKYWNKVSDGFFEDFNIELQNLIWSYIHLEQSEPYISYNKLIEDCESDEDKSKCIDPYLLDQMSATNHYKFLRFDNS